MFVRLRACTAIAKTEKRRWCVDLNGDSVDQLVGGCTKSGLSSGRLAERAMRRSEEQ